MFKGCSWFFSLAELLSFSMLLKMSQFHSMQWCSCSFIDMNKTSLLSSELSLSNFLYSVSLSCSFCADLSHQNLPGHCNPSAFSFVLDLYLSYPEVCLLGEHIKKKVVLKNEWVHVIFFYFLHHSARSTCTAQLSCVQYPASGSRSVP